MLTTAFCALLALATSIVWMLLGGTPAAVAHTAFAVAIVPLILAAISHFVPVLTRSGHPERTIAALPGITQLAGLAVPMVLTGWLPYPLIAAVALIDMLAAALLLHWIVGRARRTLGAPHPGWRWYAAALTYLIAALLAILLMFIAPGWHAAWRAVHLHLNTLGLVGLAALGTLPVLLPTALGKPDPQAAPWLRQRLPLLAGSIALIALGAMLGAYLQGSGGIHYGSMIALAGALGFAYAALSLLVHWRSAWGLPTLAADGIALLLVSALAVLALLPLAGILHAFDLMPGRSAIGIFFAGFLLPLVTGALSQLLPVWRWPGPQTPQRINARRQLARHGRGRAALALTAAGAFAFGQPLIGTVAAALLLVLTGLLLAGVDWRAALASSPPLPR